MAVDIGTAVAYLELNMTAFNQGLQQAQSALQTFKDKTSTVGQDVTAIGGLMTNVGTSLTRNLTVPIATFGKSSLESFADFEKALTGIRKTVDDAEVAEAFGVNPDDEEAVLGAYRELGKKIQEIAMRTGVEATELERIGEVSGQLGVRVGKEGENLLNFIEIMAKLGVTTNLSSDEAALALAKFINVADVTQGEVDELGAAIVDLGNNFATQESDIVYMSQRLASAGTVAGLTAQEILALSTAISSAGIKTEAGASSMSTTLSNIEMIVSGVALHSEEKLQTLADISGTTTEEFARLWEERPIEALQKFLVGLGKVNTEGESMVLFLSELGMSSIRQSNMIRSLALSSENLSSAIDTANQAFEENTALETEWNKYAATTDQQLKMLKEEWQTLRVEIGEMLLPVLQKIVDIIRDIINWWKSLDENTKQSIVRIAEVVAVLGPLLMILGHVVTGIGQIISIIEVLKGIGVAKQVAETTKIVQKFGDIVLGDVYTNCNNTALALKNLAGNFNLTAENAVIGGKAVGAFSGAAEAATPATTGLGGAVETTAASTSALSGVLTSIVGVLGVVGGTVLSVFNFFKMWNEGIDGVHAALMTLGIALAAIGAVLLGVPATVAAVVAAIAAAAAMIVLVIHENWDKIKAWAGNVKESFREWKESVKEWFAGIGKDIGEFFQNTKENFKNGLDNISNSISGFVDKIRNWKDNVVSEAKQAIGEFIGNFTNGFNGLDEKVAGLFSKLRDTVYNWGKNIIEAGKGIGISFVEGILNKFGETDGFFNDLMQSAVDTIKGFFNVFRGLGFDLLEGMWDGITESWDNIKKGLGKIADWLKEKFSWIEKLTSGVKNFFSGIADMLKINGSHANGLEYVPYDGYVAELHKGERVLTKQENEQYSRGGSGTTINFYSNEKIDEYTAAKELRTVMHQMEIGLV